MASAVAPVAPSTDSETTRPLKVVATYSVLGDLVKQVAGDKVELSVLVGADGDPHVYEPTPRDFTLDGTTPIHFVAHDGVIAIFDDGTAAIFDESAVRGDGEAIIVDSGRPADPAAADPAGLLRRHRLVAMMALASLFVALAGVVGLYASFYFNVSSGAAIVLTCTLLFALAWSIRHVRTAHLLNQKG